eukprot:1125570-Alexandrium_andersonii.AAC.1
MVPSKGSIPVASVFDVTFYVSSGLSPKDGVVGDHFMPAWLVKSTSDAAPESGTDGPVRANMDTHCRVIK